MKDTMLPGSEPIRDYLYDVERLVKMVDQTCSAEMQALLCKAVELILFDRLFPSNDLIEITTGEDKHRVFIDPNLVGRNMPPT